MRTERKVEPAGIGGSLPWHVLLRGLALTTPRLAPPVNSWMFRALSQRPPLAARSPA
jgi:hypothetical protein